MTFFWKRKPKPEVQVGDDGMTDYAREMRDLWRRSSDARESIYARVAERTGIDADVLEHMRDTDLVLALILGRSDG